MVAPDLKIIPSCVHGGGPYLDARGKRKFVGVRVEFRGCCGLMIRIALVGANSYPNALKSGLAVALGNCETAKVRNGTYDPDEDLGHDAAR